MAFVYFISESKMKAETVLHGNVDGHLIKMALQDAQDIYTREVLGTALYDQIYAQVEAGTIAGVNKYLLDNYVIKMQKFYTLKEVVFALQFKLADSSILVRTGENMSQVYMKDLETIEKRYKDKAEYWRERLNNYICKHITDYPLYQSSNQEIEPDKKSYSSGFGFFNDRTAKYYDVRNPNLRHEE